MIIVFIAMGIYILYQLGFGFTSFLLGIPFGYVLSFSFSFLKNSFEERQKSLIEQQEREKKEEELRIMELEAQKQRELLAIQKEQQQIERDRQQMIQQEEERKKKERARIEQEKRDEENRIKELRRKEEEAHRKAEEVKKIAKMKETEELMSDYIHELFKDLKNYSFSFSKQLQELVQKKLLTPYDRQVIVQKIDQEHGSFKKLLLSKKDSIISSSSTPKEFFAKEIQVLSKVQNYHQHFLDEIQTINSIGISDKVERIYKKKIAEEDYNDIRNQIFSSIAILTDLFFSLRHEDDEFATIEVSNDDFY